MRKSLFIAPALFFCVAAAFAQSPSGNPLAGLEQLKNFDSQRASSSDPNWKHGNGDFREIPPGETRTLADLEGPGTVAHIWFTIAHNAKNYSRLLTLRMYWDGEKNPSVECPIGDFFGVGHGADVPYSSLPVRVSSEGRGRNCYWPMPFRKSAKITVTNESNVTCWAFFYYIDWQKQPSLPEDTAYFHAMYRQEFPCVMGKNYLLADIEGRGHYVGTVQSVVNVSDGWYGEGDDFFFIDGEKEPRLRGTGTEDYFCDGWGFRHADGPYFGVPIFDGYRAGDCISVYRWHIPDPVAFKKSLRVEIEHKGSQEFPDGKSSGFIPRDDLMSSVAYWYQAEPHKPWPALPPGLERLPFRETTLATGEKAAAEAKHSNAPVELLSPPGPMDGKLFTLKPAGADAWLEIPFRTEKEESGVLQLRACKGNDGGIYRILLDGKPAGTIDFYGPEAAVAPEKLGWRELPPGNHTLRFECAGKNPASAGCHVTIESVSLKTPVYSRSPKVDLRTLQKK
jgi:hypothetical protein